MKITGSLLFYIIATVLFLVLGMAGAGWVTLNDPNSYWAFTGFGLASFTLAHYVP